MQCVFTMEVEAKVMHGSTSMAASYSHTDHTRNFPVQALILTLKFRSSEADKCCVRDNAGIELHVL